MITSDRPMPAVQFDLQHQSISFSIYLTGSITIGGIRHSVEVVFGEDQARKYDNWREHCQDLIKARFSRWWNVDRDKPLNERWQMFNGHLLAR